MVLKSFKVVRPEAFVSLHSSSWDASFSAINDAVVNECQFYLDVVKTIFFCGVGLFLTSVKLPQLAFLKFQEVLIFGSNIFCCRVRVILAITG